MFYQCFELERVAREKKSVLPNEFRHVRKFVSMRIVNCYDESRNYWELTSLKNKVFVGSMSIRGITTSSPYENPNTAGLAKFLVITRAWLNILLINMDF